MVGIGLTPGSPPVDPARPKACEDKVVVGNTKPSATAISDLESPLIVAGFQFNAPAESSGAATAAPPIP